MKESYTLNPKPYTMAIGSWFKCLVGKIEIRSHGKDFQHVIREKHPIVANLDDRFAKPTWTCRNKNSDICIS